MDVSLALNFVLLTGLLLAWIADALQERRRKIRDCEARGGHHWRYGYVYDDPRFPHRWCTECPAERPSPPRDAERGVV